jgi:hypothetical protein
MHVEGSVQMIQAILLHVVIKVARTSVHLVTVCAVAPQSNVQIHLYVRVATIGNGVQVVAWALVDAVDHVAWEQGRLVQVASLVTQRLLWVRVEFDHHCAVHF